MLFATGDLSQQVTPRLNVLQGVSVRKRRRPPFALGGDGFVQITGKQQRRVPRSDEVEAISDRMVAVEVHNFLEPARGERRLGGDGAGNFTDGSGQLGK